MAQEYRHISRQVNYWYRSLGSNGRFLARWQGSTTYKYSFFFVRKGNLRHKLCNYMMQLTINKFSDFEKILISSWCKVLIHYYQGCFGMLLLKWNQLVYYILNHIKVLNSTSICFLCVSITISCCTELWKVCILNILSSCRQQNYQRSQNLSSV